MMQFADTSITNLWSDDQWNYIRKNVGEWRGWFRQFATDATWVRDTPSVLTLEEDRPNQHMTLVLKRTPEGKPSQTVKRELGYPGATPYICFFPTGAFSQGAIQRRPWSSFGAEFSLLSDHRRMRLVQLYNGAASGEHILEYVTLIPEYRPTGTSEKISAAPAAERLPLDSLLGTWQGSSIYLPATMETPLLGTSHWQAKTSGADLVISDHTFSDHTFLDRTDGTDGKTQCFRAIDPHRWQAGPMQYWLLPGNVSCTVYPQLPRDHQARIELCWYLSPQRRQRIVRDYDNQGNWIGTFLALETRA